MIRWATIQNWCRGTLRFVGGLMAAAVALSLLAAPLHRALGHDHDPAHDHGSEHESKAHHCPVCALVKGQLESPDFASTTIVFVRGEVLLPIAAVSFPASPNFDLLPPGRAPPVSVIPA